MFKFFVSGVVTLGLLVSVPVYAAVTAKHRMTATKATASKGGIAGLMSSLDQITLEDLQNAKAIADAHKNTVSSACWQAWIDHNKANSAAVVDGKGNPVPLPTVHLITDAEKAIDLINDISSTGPIGIACAPLVNQTKMTAVSLVTSLATGSFITGLVIP